MTAGCYVDYTTGDGPSMSVNVRRCEIGLSAVSSVLHSCQLAVSTLWVRRHLYGMGDGPSISVKVRRCEICLRAVRTVYTAVTLQL